jgi:large subunit ribosomal protein L17
VKLGPRQSDSAPVAFLEWVDYVVKTEVAPVEKTEKPAKAEKPAKGEKTEKAGKAEKPKAEEKTGKPAKSFPKPQA